MQVLLTTAFRELFLINILLLLPLIIFGLLFSIMKKGCNRNLRKSLGYYGTLVFGIIGVPIHELSHLLMCLVFGHKITQVNLFRPIKGRYDNILGFVKHKYNTNNIYQTAGCFFIGIAPMVFGSLIVVFIIHLLFPTLIYSLDAFSAMDSLEVKHLFTTFFINAKLIITTVFSMDNFTNPFYWISMFFIVSIALHMTISKADFDNTLSGFTLLEIILFIFALLNNILDSKSINIYNYAEQISSILISVLFIAFIMFGIVYLISFIVYQLIH